MYVTVYVCDCCFTKGCLSLSTADFGVARVLNRASYADTFCGI